MPSGTVSEAEAARLLAEGEAIAKLEAKKPTWDDVAEAFGEDTIQRHADGTVTAHVEGREKVLLLHEMFRPWMRAAADRGYERQANEDRTKLKLPDGKRLEVPNRLEDQIGRTVYDERQKRRAALRRAEAAGIRPTIALLCTRCGKPLPLTLERKQRGTLLCMRCSE